MSLARIAARTTLTQRLLILIFVALLPVAANQLIESFNVRGQRNQEVRANALQQARLAAAELSAVMQSLETALNAAGRAPPVISNAGPDACRAYLSLIAPVIPQLATLGVFDPSGERRCAASGAGDTDVAGQDYFREAVETARLSVGSYQAGAPGRRSMLPIAIPIRGEANAVSHVMVAGLDLDWLGGMLAARSLPDGDSLTIADRTGVIVARKPLPDRFVGTRIPAAFLHLLNAPDQGALEVRSQDGARRILGYVPISESTRGLYVSAGVNADIAFAAIDSGLRRNIISLALSIIAAFGAAWIAGRLLIGRPARAIAAATKRWRSGDFAARVQDRAAGELGELVELLNTLAAELARRSNENRQALRLVQEREAELKRVQDIGGIAGVNVDLRNGIRNTRSPEYLKLHGLDERSIHEPHEAWKARIHPDDREEAERRLLGAVANGAIDYHDEYRIIRPNDGRIRWINSRAKIERDEDGKPLRFIGAHIDVTERREAEEALKESGKRQRLLVNELNHRVKNTLAAIIGIAHQTFRNAPTARDGLNAFMARVVALSQAHDVLTKESWTGADLRDVVQQGVAPFRSGTGLRIRTEGPPTRLTPKQALAVAMLIHELGTNAVKYGALSVASGVVLITWRVAEGEELSFRWEERDGPPVRAPEREGFGMRLIKQGLGSDLRGAVSVSYPETGLVCVATAALANGETASHAADVSGR